MDTIEELAQKVLAGDRRAIGKAISRVERGGPQGAALLRHLRQAQAEVPIVGITGSPGAGKSSLVDRLVGHLREKNLTVGVLAVDPSSPLSGGAILGDRIRMGAHATDPGVFIRSMGSRGQSGGLSLATPNAARVLAAGGFQVVLIETAGVGQTELAIAQAADTTVLVLNPETGDEIQAIKAGIMEVADLFVVNKSDLPGARQAKAHVEAVLHLAPAQAWMPPVLLTRTQPEPDGIEALWGAIQTHHGHLLQSGELPRRRERRFRREVLTRLNDRISRFLEAEAARSPLWSDWVAGGDPEAAASELLAAVDWKNVANPTATPPDGDALDC